MPSLSCPLCSKTIEFEYDTVDNGDPSTPYYESYVVAIPYDDCECQCDKDDPRIVAALNEPPEPYIYESD